MGHKPAQHSASGWGVTAELLPRCQSQTPAPLCAAPVTLWPGCSPAMARGVQVPSVGKMPCGEGERMEFLHGLFPHTCVIQKAEGHHQGGSPPVLWGLQFPSAIHAAQGRP